MRLLQSATLTALLAAAISTVLLGQPSQRPATNDDLLAEIRGLRADMKRAAETTLRAQLVTARMTLQEGRVNSLAQQLAGVRQQLSESQLTLAPFAAQLKQAQETNSQILTPLRNTLEQVQRRERELRAQETELSRLIVAEEARWIDLQSGLEDVERSLSPDAR
jgi:septal ring factor EnvC (AmiA/AmiB activator)